MDPQSLIRYLSLPLRAAPLALIAIFSLGLAFSSYGGLVGLPLAVILLSWFFKYAFIVLDYTTDGAREPPVLSVEMVNPVNEQRSLILLIIVVGIFFASDAVSYWFGPITGTVLGIAIVLVLPAIIGVQGATGSLLQSLNLYRCVRLIVRLGRDYALIVLCAAVLLGLAVWVVQITSLPLFVRIAFSMYAWLAIFAVIGGVLYERRLDIGLEAAYTPERDESKAHAETEHAHNRIMDRIYAEWRGGAHINACKTITDLLQSSADQAAELEWMYEKTRVWPDARLANQLAQAWLPHLLQAKRHGRLLEILRDRLSADPTFRPATSNQLLRCARLARDGGDRPTARTLLQGFAERYPNDTLEASVQELNGDLER